MWFNFHEDVGKVKRPLNVLKKSQTLTIHVKSCFIKTTLQAKLQIKVRDRNRIKSWIPEKSCWRVFFQTTWGVCQGCWTCWWTCLAKRFSEQS